MVVTLATSQLPTSPLNPLAPWNMPLWEDGELSVRANQPNTRADEQQQQRTHTVVVTFATSQLPSA